MIRHAKRMLTLLALGCIAAFLAEWVFYGDSLFDRIRFHKFDSGLWLHAKPHQRYFMANDLVKTNHLAGMKRDAAIDQLGTPTDSRGKEKTIGFDLGKRNDVFFPIQTTLVIEFDLQDRVDKFYVVP